MKPELSCIIISLNEEKYIEKLLKSLKNQTYKNFELILADYNSKDNTVEIAKKYGCTIVNGGKASVGRNNGAKIAKGKYLLFLDADCELPKNFLEINLKKFKESKKGIGTSPLKPNKNSMFFNLIYKSYNLFVKITLNLKPHCAGCSILCTKKVFDEINGFDEKVIFAEDHDFARRGIYSGILILPMPIITSVRRFEQEGKIKLILKMIYAGIYRIKGEIKKELFEYKPVR